MASWLIMSVSEDDTVLLDYLSSLLLVPEAVPVPLLQPCLKVMLDHQALLLPLSELGGMQAVCGPLAKSSPNQWRLDPYSNLELFDLRAVLGLEPCDYSDVNWQGHSLKLKSGQQSVLVDQIIGPQESSAGQVWHQFNGLSYTLVSA
ncbi:MAG: hypothetical protein HOH02_05600 [Oceanospirillaceae bacterium]|jgi:hypothetical protein|nr:hypothetical protein [Oceanospirillaceae bacterium]MBT6077420.1 hypothetical protein [Oceanospirillaceae bacterium]